MAFLPAGLTLASGSARPGGMDGWLRLWNVADATQTALLEGHRRSVAAVAFSADGTTLASASYDGAMRLWNVAEATHTAQLDGDSSGVNRVAFSPDGTTLASASYDGSVRLWNVADATEASLLEGHRGMVNGVAFSPDGTTLASVGDDGSVRLWDTAAATLLMSVRLGSPVGAVALRDRELAVGLHRAVAYFRIIDDQLDGVDALGGAR
jgi:WD40 repeat protein